MSSSLHMRKTQKAVDAILNIFLTTCEGNLTNEASRSIFFMITPTMDGGYMRWCVCDEEYEELERFSCDRLMETMLTIAITPEIICFVLKSTVRDGCIHGFSYRKCTLDEYNEKFHMERAKRQEEYDRILRERKEHS